MPGHGSHDPMNAIFLNGLIIEDSETGIVLVERKVQRFTILHPALRTLNSLPIALVTPPTATSIVVPKFGYQMVKAGSVVFSNPIAIAYRVPLAGTCFDASAFTPFDGSASQVEVLDMAAENFNSGPEWIAQGGIGASLFATSASDKTGGDGTVLTLDLLYEIKELAGLI